MWGQGQHNVYQVEGYSGNMVLKCSKHEYLWSGVYIHQVVLAGGCFMIVRKGRECMSSALRIMQEQVVLEIIFLVFDEEPMRSLSLDFMIIQEKSGLIEVG